MQPTRIALVEPILKSGPDSFASRHFRHDRFCDESADSGVTHLQLSSAALRAIVDEFVTCDGTDHSSVERRIELVLFQLNAGSVELHFEHETETCNILPMNESQNPPAGNGDD